MGWGFASLFIFSLLFPGWGTPGWRTDGWTACGRFDYPALPTFYTHTHSLLQLQRWRFFWDVLALLDSFRHLPMGTWLPWMPLFAFAAVAFTEYTRRLGVRLRPLLHLVCLMGDTQRTAAYLECNYLMEWDGMGGCLLLGRVYGILGGRILFVYILLCCIED
jgi:hypothetical protein